MFWTNCGEIEIVPSPAPISCECGVLWWHYNLHQILRPSSWSKFVPEEETSATNSDTITPFPKLINLGNPFICHNMHHKSTTGVFTIH